MTDFDMGNPAAMEQEDDARLQQAQQIEALTNTLLRRRREAIEGRAASGIEAIWIEDENQYNGVDEYNAEAGSNEFAVESGQQRANRSTVFLNVTQPKTDAAEARVADMLLPVDNKPWGLKPTPIPELSKLAADKSAQYTLPDGQQVPASEIAKLALEEAQKAADEHEKLIEDQQIDCNWAEVTRSMIRSCARLGTGVVKGPYPEIKIDKRWSQVSDATGMSVMQLEMIERVAPWVRCLDVWNFYPDPNCGDDVQSGSYVLERDFLTTRQVRDMLKDPRYIADALEAVIKEGPKRASRMQGNTAAQQMPGAQQDKENFEVWYYYGDMPKDDLESLGCSCEGAGSSMHASAIVTMINDRVVKASINPLETGDYPYHVMPWDRVPGQLWGRGVPRKMATPQRIVNAATRAMMDNAGLSLGPQIVFAEDSIEPVDGVFEVTGRKLWRLRLNGAARTVQEAMAVFNVPTNQGALANIIEFGLRMADEVTGLPLLLQGDRGSAPDTVGGMQMLMQSASIVLKRMAKQFDDKYVRPQLRAWYDWNMQHSDNPDIKGDLQIDARGASELAARDQANQFLMVAGQFVGNPAFGINPKKLFAEMAQANHYDPRKIQFTDEEIQQQQEQQQPPPPPPQIAVAQIRAESDQAKMQFEAQESEKERQFAMLMAQFEAQIKQAEAEGHKALSLADIRAKLTDSAMKARNQQQLLAAELVHANQYGRGV